VLSFESITEGNRIQEHGRQSITWTGERSCCRNDWWLANIMVAFSHFGILLRVVPYPFKRSKKWPMFAKISCFSPLVERYPSVATNFYRTINLYGCQPWYPWGSALSPPPPRCRESLRCLLRRDDRPQVSKLRRRTARSDRMGNIPLA